MNETVVFLGVTDNYPFQYSANNSKNELLARALTEENCNVSIINSLGGFRQQESVKQGKKEDVEYFVFRKGGVFQIFLNVYNTYKALIQIKKRSSGKQYLLMGYNYFPIFIFYAFVARILGYKTLVVITEWHLYFQKQSTFKKLNYFLFDHLFGHFVDGIIPISEVIANKIKHFKRPVLKVPILADYNLIQAKPYIKESKDVEYFLYCGDIAYWDVIEFTINCFHLFSNKISDKKLVLVINGKPSDISKAHTLIDNKGLGNLIFIKSKLPLAELIEMYQGALALLIPLRTEMQDTARFPHKIGEYIATGRPIITAEVGEVGIYFRDRVNAYMAKQFCAKEYSNIMEQVATNKVQANLIGCNGRMLGEQNFHYSNYSQKILNFFNTL